MKRLGLTVENIGVEKSSLTLKKLGMEQAGLISILGFESWPEIRDTRLEKGKGLPSGNKGMEKVGLVSGKLGTE
jgi:hypothetical protein